MDLLCIDTWGLYHLQADYSDPRAMHITLCFLASFQVKPNFDGGLAHVWG